MAKQRNTRRQLVHERADDAPSCAEPRLPDLPFFHAGPETDDQWDRLLFDAGRKLRELESTQALPLDQASALGPSPVQAPALPALSERSPLQPVTQDGQPTRVEIQETEISVTGP